MVARAAKSAPRSYDQYCAVARGLDVIGDRWTLLLVRDLLLGPKRYKDLLSGLPGIGKQVRSDPREAGEHVLVTFWPQQEIADETQRLTIAVEVESVAT